MGRIRKYTLTDRCTVSVQRPDDQVDACVVGIEGELDSESYEEFGAVVERLLDGRVRRLVIDCGALKYISSSGVGMFMVIQRRLDETGGRMAIACPRGSVKEVLDILHLGDIVTQHASVDLALAALGAAE